MAAPGEAPAVAVTQVTAGQQAVISSDVTPAPAGPQIPEGGSEKFWDATNGTYNWEAHAREQMWQKAQSRDPGQVSNLQPTPGAPGQHARTGEVPSGQVSNPNAAPPPPPAAPAPVAPVDAAAAQTAVNAGVDLTAFNTYVAENGVASPEHLATFAAAGIPAEVVNDYVATKMEAVEQQQKAVVDFIGGQGAIDQLDTYMQANLSADEISQFTKQLMEPTKWKATAGYLMSAAGLAAPGRGLKTSPNAQPTPATSGASFATEADFNAAMRDPRYKADPTFRASVEQSLRNSPALVKAGSGSRHTAGV